MNPSQTHTPPVRRLALQILCRVETTGAFADQLVSHLAASHRLAPEARGFLRELTYGVLRWRNRLDWWLAQCSDRALASLTPQVRNLLRLGAYQLCAMTHIPPYAAVSETVRLAHQVEHAGVAAFVNAVLRALARRREALALPGPDEDLLDYLTVTESHPRWLVERWLSRFGPAQTIAMCQANNQRPPLVLRANRRRASRERLLEALRADGCRAEPCAFAPDGVRLDDHPPLERLRAYQDGWFAVQDEAAILCGYLVAPQPGERVLDACGAPGGKATHLAELMDDRGEVVCLDVNPRRLRLVEDTARRLGLRSLACVPGDATRIAFDAPFDRILVDAPCSGLGVLRRHPDAKWRKDAALIATMARQQRAILLHISQFVKPGGRVVYVTCSTEPEENQDVVRAFLQAAPAFRGEDAAGSLPETARRFVRDEGWFQTWPGPEGLDGFFGACLRRTC
jgi:16S rRNA (cytosine967-C5)-methyltransferase